MRETTQQFASFELIRRRLGGNGARMARKKRHPPLARSFSQRLGSQTKLLPGLAGNHVSTGQQCGLGQAGWTANVAKLAAAATAATSCDATRIGPANARRVDEMAVWSIVIFRGGWALGCNMTDP